LKELYFGFKTIKKPVLGPAESSKCLIENSAGLKTSEFNNEIELQL